MNLNDLKKLITSEWVTVVDFYAPWCWPCKMLWPILEKLENDWKIKLIKINVDENPWISEEMSIMSIPHLYIYKNWIEIYNKPWLMSEEQILSLI